MSCGKWSLFLNISKWISSQVIHQATQSSLTLSQNCFPNWILNWIIILALQLDWTDKYLQQTEACFWALTGLHSHINARFPLDFWKDISKNGNASDSRMCLQVNLKYISLFLLTKFPMLYEEALESFFTREQTVRGYKGRGSSSVNQALQAHLDGAYPRSPGDVGFIHHFSSFLMSARILWMCSESFKIPSEVFSPGKITQETICTVNYISHSSLLVLFIIFYSTAQRNPK